MKSTVTESRASGWHSGIRSAVRLAAMMPARRATSSTSPFLAAALADHGERRRQHPHAAAGPGQCGGVTGLSPTSTMRLAPAASKWVRSAIGGLDRVRERA